MNKNENYKDKNKGLDFIVTIYWFFFPTISLFLFIFLHFNDLQNNLLF